MTDFEPISFVGKQGNRLAADVCGPEGAPPVLFFHGGGQTRYSWGGASRRLGALGWRAIAIDQRGHGESDWAEDGAYTFADFADDLLCVVRQARERFGDKPVCVGASLGGISSLLAAEHHQDEMAALVLVDITPTVNQEGVERIRAFMQEHMDEGFATLEEAAEAIQTYLPHRKRDTNLEGLRKNLRKDDDGRYRWHWDPKFWNGPHPVSTGRTETRERMIASAKGLHVPVLLVRGQRSELVDEEHAREFLELVPHAKLADISGAGHMIAGDRNDIFASAIVSFLEPLKAPAV
jgi:pimeloyl-ACP methyl ester carboxylesterase